MRPVYRRVCPHRRGLDPSQLSSHHQKNGKKPKISIFFLSELIWQLLKFLLFLGYVDLGFSTFFTCIHISLDLKLRLNGQDHAPRLCMKMKNVSFLTELFIILLINCYKLGLEFPLTQ